MNILFVFAHPDDEAFGPYGTMAELSKDNVVHAWCLCNGARPGFEQVADHRTRVFEANCERYNIQSHVGQHKDLQVDYQSAVAELERAVKLVQPRIVYTHNISDLNMDHRIVSDATMVACRPKPDSCVDWLYYYEIVASTDWSFNKIEPQFQPNTYQDVSEFIKSKRYALDAYTTETYPWPDARSVEAMITLARYRGQQVGLDHAEAFQLVFSRIHKSL